MAKELLETEKDYIQYLNALVNVRMTCKRREERKKKKKSRDKQSERENKKRGERQKEKINVVQVYLIPLREKAESDTPLLTLEEVRTIFPQIEMILLYNKQLYDVLDERIRYILIIIFI